MTDEDLTPDQLEPLEKEKGLCLIAQGCPPVRGYSSGFGYLENADRLNQPYAPANSGVRTPSQIKKFYLAGHGCQWRPDHGCEACCA